MILLVILIIFFLMKIYRNSTSAKTKRGFYRLDGEKMYQEEYNDRMAMRDFNNHSSSPKDQLLTTEYRDFSDDSDSENDVMFNRT